MPEALGGPGVEPYDAYYYDLSNLTGATFESGESVVFRAVFERHPSVRFQYRVAVYGTSPASSSSKSSSSSSFISSTSSSSSFVSSTSSSSSSSAPANQPPQIFVEPPEVEISEGETAVINASAQDPDGDRVSLGAEPRIENALFTRPGSEQPLQRRVWAGESANGSFVFTPGPRQHGTFLVSFTARDVHGASAVKTARIIVGGINQAPEISVPEAAEVDEGGLLMFKVEVSDADGDPVEVVPTDVPENALYIAPTQTFIFTPDFEQAGEYVVSFEANDGQVSSGKKGVVLTVNDVDVEEPEVPTELVLDVDEVENPTLLEKQRITGSVNSGFDVPGPAKAVSALITGLQPASAKQGQTVDVIVSGSTVQFPTHFAAGSTTADFGPDVTVNSVSVTSASEAVVNVTVARQADVSVRSITLRTGSETAVSLVGFSVERGLVKITGTLIDPDTGLPVKGAVITVEGTQIAATTDENGAFSLSDVPSGTQNLLVNPPNHKFFVLTVDAQVGEPIVLGEIGSSTTVFDPSAPDAVSIFSVLGRGAGSLGSEMDRVKLKALVIDTLLLVGGEELGVLDEYGNQLNPLISGQGMLSLTDKALEGLIDRMQRGQTWTLQDILLSISFGFRWGGTGEPLKADEWLSMLQSLVDKAWSDQTNPDNAFAILVFNNKTSLSPEPPRLSLHTTFNPLQAFIFTNSLLIEMQTSLEERSAALFGEKRSMLARAGDWLVPPAYAQRAAGRYTRFWRNAFDTKGSWPMNQLRQGMGIILGVDAALMGASIGPNLVGSVGAQMFAGWMSDDFSELVKTMAQGSSTIDPPVLLGYNTRTGGVQIGFTSRYLGDGYEDSYGSKVFFTLIRFKNALSQPQVVEVMSAYELQHGRDTGGSTSGSTGQSFKYYLQDTMPPGTYDPKNPPSNPEESVGTWFYTMTTTYSRRNLDTVEMTGVGKNALIPWWGNALSTAAPGALSRSEYYAYWLNAQTHVQVSDFAAPVIYEGDILPDLGEIDALAVDARSGEEAVFVSNTAEGTIKKMPFEGNALGEAALVSNTGFKAPGQKGLAIDPMGDGDLYTDNAASDSQFGGRLFKFPQKGGKEFVGTVNYFSQLLMYANPVSVGVMCMDGWGGLFVFERISREVRRVPITAPWDPYRKVGRPWYRFPSDEGSSSSPGGPSTKPTPTPPRPEDSNVIDLEVVQEKGVAQKLYLLTTSEILGIPGKKDSYWEWSAEAIENRFELSDEN